MNATAGKAVKEGWVIKAYDNKEVAANVYDLKPEDLLEAEFYPLKEGETFTKDILKRFLELALKLSIDRKIYFSCSDTLSKEEFAEIEELRQKLEEGPSDKYIEKVAEMLLKYKDSVAWVRVSGEGLWEDDIMITSEDVIYWESTLKLIDKAKKQQLSNT